MKSFLFKRKSWIRNFAALSIIAGISTVATLESHDPLHKEMGALEVKVNQVLVDPAFNFEVDETGQYKGGSLIGYLKSRGLAKKDKLILFSDAKFQALFSEVVVMAKKIKDASSAREKEVSIRVLKRTTEILKSNDSQNADILIAKARNEIQNEVFGKYAAIVARYFQIQKRLVAVQIKTAHHTKESIYFNPNLLNGLNLKLGLSVGQFLATSQEFSMLYNLWHVRNPETQAFDQVEVGLTPEDRSNMEQAILEDVKTQYGYSKLIQLLSLRERIINQWATERLSIDATSLKAPDLTQCAAFNAQSQSGLVSFLDQPNENTKAETPGDYYEFLWKKDRFDEFVGTFIKEKEDKASNATNAKTVLGQIATKTFDRPLVTRDQLEVLLLGFFEQFSESKTEVSSASVADISESTVPVNPFAAAVQKARVEQKIETFAEKYKSYLDQQIGVIETEWRSKARAALMDANYMQDRWDNAIVAERTALYAYQFRRKYLADVTFFQALTLKKLPSDLTQEQYESYYQKALARVDQFTAPKKDAWIKSVKDAVVVVLKSDAVKQIRTNTKDLRLSKRAESLQMQVLAGAKAKYADHKIEQLAKANIANGAWVQKGFLFHKKEFEYGFIAAKDRLKDLRIKLWLPDQLTKFYFEKLNYWRNAVDPNKSYLPKLATEIQENKHVMKGIRDFFTIINNDFMELVEKRKLSPELITSENTPLYEVVQYAAYKSYKKFEKEIQIKPEVIYTPAPQSNMFPSDHVDHTLAINKVQYDFKNYVPANDRKRVLELYVQALSVLNLGGFANHTQVGEDVFSFESKAKLVQKPGGGPSLLKTKWYVNNVRTFLQMESILVKESALTVSSVSNMSERLFASLLDQRLLARILAEEPSEKNPVLAIQYAGQDNWLNNPDVNAPTVFDLAVQSYTPQAGLPVAAIKHALSLGLKKSTAIVPGLIKEACIAKPRIHDNTNYQNLFKGSRALRRTYSESDAKFKELDDKLTEFTQTPLERKEANLTKALGVGFMVFMVCIALYFGCALPVFLGFTEAPLLAGMWTAMTKLGSVMIIPSLVSVKGFFTLANLFVITGVFVYQVALQYQVGCIELPNQLRYQLNISNSQVSELAKPQIAREDLRWLSSNIHQMYMNVQVGVVMNAIFLPQIAGQVKVMTGALGLKAIERIEVAETIQLMNGEVARVAKLKTPTTLKQFIAQEGKFLGPLKYTKQTFTDAFVNGQLRSVNVAATTTDVQMAMNARYANVFKSTANLEEGILMKNNAVKLRADKIMRSLENNKVIKARLASYGKIDSWTEFVRTLKPSYLWEEIGYNLRNFFDRYISLAKLEKRKLFKVVMEQRLLRNTDEVTEVIWNPQTKTFKISPKNPNAQSVERIVVDNPTAAEISELMKIAELNELAKEYMVNERLIGYVHESRQAVAGVTAAETKVTLGQETMQAGQFVPSSQSAQKVEYDALLHFFDRVTTSNQWQHVNPIFKFLSNQSGVPSQVLKDLRVAIKDEQVLMSEAAMNQEPEFLKMQEEMKAQAKAQEEFKKKYDQETEDYLKNLEKEENTFTPYEDVTNDSVHEFEIVKDGVNVVPPAGASFAPDGSWFFGDFL